MLRADLFIGAQAIMYEQAIRELNLGQKKTHWMWFIFPQHVGLGSSERSKLFGLTGLTANEYYVHPILGQRLSSAVDISVGFKDPVRVFGLDALKLKSCLTLFDNVTNVTGFRYALNVLFDGEECQRTLQFLEQDQV